jgi:hypothetical protein
VVTFNGIEERFGPVTRLSYHFLRSWIEKDSGARYHQLYIHHKYGDTTERNFYRASLEGGKDIEFTKYSTAILDCLDYRCTYQEDFAVKLDERFLMEHSRGFGVKFYARSGHEVIVHVSPRQIQKQLYVLSRYEPQPSGS